MRQKGKSTQPVKRLFSSVSSRYDISDAVIAAIPVLRED
jgi:hypothetical protein